jgi:hypothetical protein
MRHIKILGLACIAVVAMSTMVASAAFADAGYELKTAPATGKEKFTSTSGLAVLSVPKAGVTEECKSDTDVGQWSVVAKVVSKTNVEKVKVEFEGCEVKGAGKVCKVANVKTESLRGEVGEFEGTVKEQEEGKGEVPALLLQPEEPKKGFTKLPVSECNPETTVTGNIAGEIPAKQGKSKTQKVNFNVVGGKQQIKTLETNADAKVTTKLSAFGFEATEATKDVNTFEEELELVEGV